MSMRLDLEGALVRVTLEGELSVADVKAMHATLLERLEPESEVIISAADVTRIDAAVLQLVHAVGVYVKAMRVDVASPAWWEAIRLLGLERPLESDS